MCPVVAVGGPPVPVLPSTGGPVGFGAALVLFAAGAVLLFAVRPNWRRKAPIWHLRATQPPKRATTAHQPENEEIHE